MEALSFLNVPANLETRNDSLSVHTTLGKVVVLDVIRFPRPPLNKQKISIVVFCSMNKRTILKMTKPTQPYEFFVNYPQPTNTHLDGTRCCVCLLLHAFYLLSVYVRRGVSILLFSIETLLLHVVLWSLISSTKWKRVNRIYKYIFNKKKTEIFLLYLPWWILWEWQSEKESSSRRRPL